MSELHLHETELACVTSGEVCVPADANAPASAGVAEHLRWCTQCRSTAAEYRWLEERIEDALAEAASTVSVPRPKWQAIRRQMTVEQNRQVTGWRASATAGITLAICAILSLSSIVGGMVIAQTSSPEAVMTPASVTAILSDGYVPSGATPTPGASCAGMESLSTLTLPTIPTPPEPDV
jgi:hypothetical protein